MPNRIQPLPRIYRQNNGHDPLATGSALHNRLRLYGSGQKCPVLRPLRVDCCLCPSLFTFIQWRFGQMKVTLPWVINTAGYSDGHHPYVNPSIRSDRAITSAISVHSFEASPPFEKGAIFATLISRSNALTWTAWKWTKDETAMNMFIHFFLLKASI